MIDSIYRKDENYYPKVFLGKYYFIEDIEIYCSNSDAEYYDEECINLFLKTLKKSEISISPKYKKIFKSRLFLFFELEYKEFFSGFLFPEI